MSRFKFAIPIFIMLLVILIFHYTNWIVAKYYPVIVNFVLFCIFFGSTFSEETVIQKMAKLMEPNIKPKALEYTRRLTSIWSIFMLANFFISLATVFMSEKVWAIYNGFLSYMLVGGFFIIEYMVRINFKKKYDC